MKIAAEHCHPPNEAKLEAEKLKIIPKSNKAKQRNQQLPFPYYKTIYYRKYVCCTLKCK